MRISPALLWLKAHVTGSVSARVKLSVRSPGNGLRFSTALVALHNRETRLTRQWRGGELSLTQLVDRSRRLTDLRQTLINVTSPTACARSHENLLIHVRDPHPRPATRGLAGSLESLLSKDRYRERVLSVLADAVWSGRLNALHTLRAEVLAAARISTGSEPPLTLTEAVASVFDALQARAPVGACLGVEWGVLRHLRTEMLTNREGPDGRVATNCLPHPDVVRDMERSASLPARLAPLAADAPPKPPRAMSMNLRWRPGESAS
ncbi:hypothetical protein [Stenotrophomonas sp. PD6]|uniref:hypothetical protein n=1 Tax=Stenotrophomonas sp. PD6 TaxID=3368612 RepID=UPI003BA1513D